MLVDDVARELPRMRAEAEALMVDACSIGANRSVTFDVDTETYVSTPGTAIYSGPCQVQMVDSIGTEGETVGEQLVVTSKVVVKIPVSAPAIPVNFIVTITDTGEGSDPSLVGKDYKVSGVHAKTYATARRLPCELVTA